MNLFIETIFTSVYFDPERCVNLHGLIYLHNTDKPDSLSFLRDNYSTLDKFIRNYTPAR